MARPSSVVIERALADGESGTDRAASDGRSLATRVTERLREAIVDGELALGEALSELRLAAVLDVSRTPVREALTNLQREGLIEIRPQAGSFVFMPSEEDVAELAEFRRVIETTALRFGFARRRDETLRALREAADAMDRAREADDRLGVARADSAFHRAIAENSANAYLISAYRLVSGRVAALRTHNLKAGGAIPTRSLNEHRAVIAALAKGDLDGAEAVLAEHVWKMRLVFQIARHRRGGAPVARAKAGEG